MKILHITSTHLEKYAGIPEVLKKLVKYQNKIKDITSKVLSVKSPVDKIESKHFVFYDKYEDIFKYIDIFNPDVVIFHGLYFFKYIRISNYLKSINVRYYIQPHSSFMLSAQKRNIKKYLANKLVFNKFINNAYGYIFLNEEEKYKSIFRKEKDIIIPNGIENMHDNISLKDKNNSEIVIYFIGRIDIKHKGLDLLLEDLKKIDNKKRNFVLNIYGPGLKTDIKYITKKIKDFKNLKIFYKGPIYDEDKYKMLKKSNIMILTSRYEGFPMTVLEALYFGNPCIVSEGTNVSKLIQNNNLGWAVGKNSISKTLLYAIDDYLSKKELYVFKTRDFILNNYDWEIISHKSVKLLKEGN
jgi:glycosyltransferase involved in cell wall biosynthesis